MSTTEQAKAPVGLKRLSIWPITVETETEVTYGDVKGLSKRIMTAKATPNISEGTLEADNQVVDKISTTDGYALELGLTALTSSERSTIYGETIENGTNITSNEDMSNYICVAYSTTRSDGKLNLFKYPKAIFSPSEENFETRKKGTVSFQTTVCKGEAMPLLKDVNSRYVRYGVDPKTDAELIESWFTNAEFYKPETV